ncbi:hypothetical protein ACFPYI_11925 [Halomarina salina]|uniref:Uncharacterized protein n=1 Tax=Halomarina salina TaxID=1872699 RepID=A0ABD5RNN4_9EURY|nr:hypothetical protein [Halomarina salina]
MDDDDETATTATVPEELRTSVDELDERAVRTLVEYCRRRLDELHDPVSTHLEPQPGEEFVEVTEREAYTEVVKREPCAEGCSDCPHGPFLYHVTEERHPDGTTHLHWASLGPVEQ